MNNTYIATDTHAVITGIDEAGRGALAGPVVAAACVLPASTVHPLIQDSKVLTPKQREEAFEWICKQCIFGIGIVDEMTIDADGILQATESAMQLAVQDLATKKQPTYLLVDGRDRFWFDYPHSSIIGGDALEPCIAAASIAAKVTRDRIMQQYDASFPQYHFGQHKGYGTEEHIGIIRSNGACPIHRITYLKKIFSAKT